MEIEAKFTVVGALEPAAVAALKLRPYHLRAAGEEEHVDTVLDTAARVMTAQHSELRLRSLDGHLLVTYKGPDADADATHEREEIEATLAQPPGEDYRRWSAEIARHIEPLVGDEPLLPLLHMTIHRQKWLVLRHSQTIAEIALDTGTIHAGGQRMAVRELEIELKEAGTRDDLAALRECVLAQLPLQPEPRSKLARGLALLDEAEHLPASYRTLEDVGRERMRKLLKKIRVAEPVAREGGNPEGVHKMRVATRRLRSTLRVLERASDLPSKRLRRFRRDLKGLAHALGGVRDLDVFLALVQSYAEEQPDMRADLDVLSDYLAARRAAAHARLVKYLANAKTARLFDRLDAFLRAPFEQCATTPITQVRTFAGSAIWAHYEAGVVYETILAQATIKQLHQLRIACKRARYTVELFAPALGDRADHILAALTSAQDVLGTLRDASTLRDQVLQFSDRTPTHPGLAVYAAALAAVRDERRLAFASIWAEVIGQPFREELANILGHL